MHNQNEYLTYLVETYGDMVYRLAITRVRNPHDAEDIVQKVFLKLVKHIDHLESEEHVKAWLIRVTANGRIDLAKMRLKPRPVTIS